MTSHVRFDHYMNDCLYGIQGFYTSGGGVAGRRGDFITSPEVGPLFGAVIARWIEQRWLELGRPEPLPVLDVGSGPGTLVSSLRRVAPPGDVWRIDGVDRAHGRALPERLDGALVVANELLDNLAVRIVERRADGWHELYVRRGSPVLVPLDDADVVLPAALADLPIGRRAPWHRAAHEWVSDVMARGAAGLLVLDYGLATTAELAQRGGWLRTYRRHERGSDPFSDPGRWDITTDIGFDQLPPPLRLVTQRSFLIDHGIEELVEHGRRHWATKAQRPDVEAMVMRSRVRESEALLDTDGLGGWLVGEWRAEPAG